MKSKHFTAFEGRAVNKAGERAGAYLDKLEKTDLASLSPDEWFQFCQIMIEQFGVAIREMVASDEAPF